MQRDLEVSRFGEITRFLLILTLLVGGAGVSAADLPPQDGRKDQIRKIETDLSREREQLLKFHEREKELLDHLSTLEKDIAEQRQSHAQSREKLNRSREDLERLRERLSATEKSLHRIEQRLAKRLVTFYKYSKRGALQVLFAARDLEDLARKAKQLKHIMHADRRLFAETLAMQQERRQEIAAVQAKLAMIERMEKEDTDRLLQIKEDLDKKVLVLIRIHKERDFYETAVKELELAARGLREKLISLEKSDAGPGDLPSNFSAQKGRLPLPCGGKVLRPAAGGGENGFKGVLILSPGGGDVKAVFPGRVEFSGHLRGYGEIVVINHGNRYYTVTGYLDRRQGEEGRLVKAGDVIGTLRREDPGGGGRLYFEIRKGGINVDPVEWLKPH